MKNEEFENWEEEQEKERSILQFISSLSVTGVVMSIVVSMFIGNGNTLAYLLSVAAGTIMVTPFTYIGSMQVEKLLQRKSEKELSIMYHTFSMLEEQEYMKDQVIDKTTTNFLKKIGQVFAQEEVAVDDLSLNTINSFIYMINMNYYDQIKKHHPSFQREQLIDTILSQICVYLQQKDKQTFTEKDVPKLMENCFFIPEEEKKQIIREFKSSKVHLGKWTDYVIKCKETEEDVVEMDSNKKKIHSSNFDIENPECYQLIVQNLTALDQYLVEFGDVTSLEWDFESLQKIMVFVATKYRSKLIEEREMYSNFELVNSFVYNAMCYAIVNGKSVVGKDEMLSTFKEWEYISWGLRREIVSDFLENDEKNLDEMTYSCETKKKAKVISFSTYCKNKNRE